MPRKSSPRTPKRCTSYAAGHEVHWIQALHVGNRPEVRALTRNCRVLAVDGDVITIDAAGEGVELLNHQTSRLLALCPPPPFRARWNERYALLSCPHRKGYVGDHMVLRDTYEFSVRRADDGPLGPCPTDQHTDLSPAGLVERVVTHGGYSASVRAVSDQARDLLGDLTGWPAHPQPRGGEDC